MVIHSLSGLNVAIYARYSSDLQRPASIDDQVRRCSAYVQERGGKVASELVFSDAAKSGASLVRNGFEQLMKLVRQRPRGVDAIVVEDMSRVTRDLADASHLFRELRYLDIPLVGVADGVDTSGKDAKVTFTVSRCSATCTSMSSPTRRAAGSKGEPLRAFQLAGSRWVPERAGMRPARPDRRAQNRTRRSSSSHDPAHLRRVSQRQFVRSDPHKY